MSTKVVTAPASQAKRPVRSDKPAQQAENTPAANEDEARLADDSEEEVSVASVHEEGEAPVESETSMAGEFTFGSALAEAAAASGSLITDAESADEVGFGAFGDKMLKFIQDFNGINREGMGGVFAERSGYEK